MDMSVDVVLWLDPLLYCGQEFNAAGPDPGAAVVPIAHGGRVRDQQVRALRDLVPLGQAGGTFQ